MEKELEECPGNPLKPYVDRHFGNVNLEKNFSKILE